MALSEQKMQVYKTRVLSHKDFDSREAYDAELMDIIDNFEPNLVVLAGFYAYSYS